MAIDLNFAKDALDKAKQNALRAEHVYLEALNAQKLQYINQVVNLINKYEISIKELIDNGANIKSGVVRNVYSYKNNDINELFVDDGKTAAPTWFVDYKKLRRGADKLKKEQLDKKYNKTIAK
jgi:hypothetical protein